MENQEIKKQITRSLILILIVTFVFMVKGIWDNRLGAHYSHKLQDVVESLESGSNLANKELHSERMEIQKNLSRIYRFPKLLFFFLVIVNTALAVASLLLLSKLPSETDFQRRSSFRLITVLVVAIFVTLCFLLMEYHKVTRLGWVILLGLIQIIVIGFSWAVVASDEIYNLIMGKKKDKDLIEGEPPPAW